MRPEGRAARAARTATNVGGPAVRAITAVVVALAVLVTPVPRPAASAEHGLVFDATTTYVLDVEAEVVRVEVDARLTNTLPVRQRGNIIETPFFDKVGIPVVGPVTAITATGPSGSLATTVERGDTGADHIVVDLSPNLVNGAPQDLTVRYELPAQPPRSEAITRVNQAYAAWFVVVAGDPGSAQLRIEVPRDFELGIAATPAELDTRRDGEHLVISSDGTAAPDGLYFALSVVREDAMVAEELTFGDATVTVRGWPDDTEWQDFATDLVERGIPVLTELVGRPLPDPTITVLETSGGAHIGYGGFYGADGTIEVSDETDAETLLHELAHGWINGRLFSERWLLEGVTQEVTRRATDHLDVEVDPVPELDADAAVAVPLNDWGWSELFDDERPALEAWGYDASYSVANQLLGDLADDRFAAVLGAALDGDIAYQGDPDPERVVVADDWRYLLDLVEELGDVRTATDVYREHVVTAEQVGDLEARAAARAAYRELVERSGTWSPPFPVRQAMARWEFGEVEPLIATADDVRAEADRLAAELEALGGSLPAAVETAYESEPDLDAVAQQLAALDAVVARLASLREERRGLGTVGRIGLLGSDATLHDAAVAAASAGDLDRAGELADREARLLASAATVGALRLAAVALLLALGAGLVVWRRRRAPTPEAPTPDAQVE